MLVATVYNATGEFLGGRFVAIPGHCIGLSLGFSHYENGRSTWLLGKWRTEERNTTSG